MTHTPGPWRVHSEHADRIIVNGCCVYQVGNLAVPDSYEPGVMGEPNPADVRLMAAAPELLRLIGRLREVFEQLSDGDWRHLDATYVDQLIESDGLHACEQAIAKAEGRE